MTEGSSRPRVPVVGRALLALLIGVLAGAGLNAMLGDKGADTPALALLGGAIALRHGPRESSAPPQPSVTQPVDAELTVLM